VTARDRFYKTLVSAEKFNPQIVDKVPPKATCINLWVMWTVPNLEF
jgi:hypothetical protein